MELRTRGETGRKKRIFTKTLGKYRNGKWLEHEDFQNKKTQNDVHADKEKGGMGRRKGWC